MIKKRRLYLFLAVLLLFTYIVPSFIEVSAAKKKIINIYSDDIIVENGRRFYFGDMVTVELDKKSYDRPLTLPAENELLLYTATEMGATYVSDCPEILAIEKKSGYAQAKRAGTANIIVNCHGAYASFPVTVAEIGTLNRTLQPGKEDITEKLDAAGKKLSQKIPEKLTPENGYDLFRALKTYLAVFVDYKSTYSSENGISISSAMCGWDPDRKFRMAPACSCYKRAYSMVKHYVAKYHPMNDKKYWTAEDGQYFTVSATVDQITLKMKKKLTKQALLALYLNEFLCETDGYGPDGVILPLSISATVQKDRFEACSYIARYKDTDERYGGHTVTVFKLGSKTATVTHVYRSRYTSANARHKHIQKKKLKLKKGKKYWLRIDTLYWYWPGEFVVK